MSCSPLELAEDFIAKIRRLREDAETVLDGIPDTLEELLECISVGYADRTTAVLDDGALEAYDYDSLKARVDQIFDAVTQNQADLADQFVSTPATNALAAATSAAGLWMLTDPANTFYGLAMERTEYSLETCFAIETAVGQAEEALEEFTRIADQLHGPEGEALLRQARLLIEEICPEVTSLTDALKAIALSVGSSRNLATATCGATSLQDRLRTLIEGIPFEIRPGSRLVQAAALLKERMDVVDQLTSELNTTSDRLVEFDEQIQAGSFAVQTEQAMFEALAEQLAEVCAEIASLAARRRYAEMVALQPRLREICGMTIVALQSTPEQRVTAIALHDARAPFKQWTDALRNTARVPAGSDAMEAVYGSLAGAIIEKADDLEKAVIEVEEVFDDARRMRDIYLTAGHEFLALTQEVVDQACAGALRRLLYKYGYEELEDLFAYGLFGNLPEATYRAATAAGKAIDCMRQLVTGTLALAEPLTGEQRFALENAVDTMRILEDSTHRIALLAQELDIQPPSPAAAINEVADVIEREVRGALRGIGSASPTISNTRVEPDGFVRFFGDLQNLPSGIVKAANGFLRAETGAPLPSGYGKTPEGYLIATA